MEHQSTVRHRFAGVPIKTLRLEVTKGPDAGKQFTARSDTVTVGTAPGNDLVLTDSTVSRHHVELRRSEDRVLVVDLGSTNGTNVQGVWIERGSVFPGCTVELGKTAVQIGEGDPVTVQLYDGDQLGRVRGSSLSMRTLMAKMARAAQSDAAVLLLGETGTGKEVIAQTIHEESARAGRPFETVDCAALLPALVASELFGHEKGAFTGADRLHVGAFERAHGGTIFLDEIGELPPPLQAALLGVLERRRFRRLGGEKEIEVDVRVIAATHRDLRAAVNAETFRQDLYFRLAVLLLRIPPLRERVDDIPLLAEHFLHQTGFDGPLESVLPPNAMQALKLHQWPGNVRELRNVIEATVAMGELPEMEAASSQAPVTPGEFPSVPLDELTRRTFKDARALLLSEFEAIYLDRLFARTGGNVSKAARESQLNRNYLTQILKRHGIK
ncbi:MAG: sigma 54-dependent Fis family transcriptional regulator [Deltaproteobacteria bacterium]|nr:sigma 54-dependent Fis family transcriptional regulator [Deltaproteobacteria bacterium]